MCINLTSQVVIKGAVFNETMIKILNILCLMIVKKCGTSYYLELSRLQSWLTPRLLESHLLILTVLIVGS
jgi:hypothetical protein